MPHTHVESLQAFSPKLFLSDVQKPLQPSGLGTSNSEKNEITSYSPELFNVKEKSAGVIKITEFLYYSWKKSELDCLVLHIDLSKLQH